MEAKSFIMQPLGEQLPLGRLSHLKFLVVVSCIDHKINLFFFVYFFVDFLNTISINVLPSKTFCSIYCRNC